MAGVKLEGVSKTFPGGVTAVDGLSLDVLDREFLVLLGPSGCGKSTTLRMIAGLELSSEGEIYIGQRAVGRVPPKDRDIAMVFQNYALYPHMTVYKNMAFGLELRYGGGVLNRIWNRLTRPQQAAELAERRRGIRDRVREAARILGIEELLQRMPRQLSGGERQRVALGRAIVRNPAAFLFDEPLSNLDAKLRVEMRRELKRLHQTLQATIVYVTHDQVEALTLGQRIVVMDRGKIQQIGPPMEVYDRPRNRFVAGFIGAPPMNFIAGKLEETQNKMRFVGDGLTVELESDTAERLKPHMQREVELGVRPEDVVIEPRQSTETENQGCLEVIESLGDAVVLHVRLASKIGREKDLENLLVCKAEPRTRLQGADSVSVKINSRRTHIFDVQSGRNLSFEDLSGNET